MAEHKKPLGLLPRAREEREERGLTYSQMAEVLGLGEHQVESGAIKGYESGMPVSNGSVVRIYQELQRARLQSQTWLKVPRFTLARDADSVVLHHNDWPRFVAKAVPEALHKEQWRFAKAGMPVYELRLETGLSQAIFSFIDHVPADFDAEEVLEEAVVAIEVKSGRAPSTFPGLADFAAAFTPTRTLIVGGAGLSLEEFLRAPVEQWLRA